MNTTNNTFGLSEVTRNALLNGATNITLNKEDLEFITEGMNFNNWERFNSTVEISKDKFFVVGFEAQDDMNGDFLGYKINLVYTSINTEEDFDETDIKIDNLNDIMVRAMAIDEDEEEIWVEFNEKKGARK